MVSKTAKVKAGEGEKSTTNNPLNRPKYQRAEGVTKYWSPFFSPLSNIYNVPTEEPTAAERLAVLHLFFFAADFVAVKTGANMEGGFFFSNFALFADAVKTQNEWWRLPSAALADFGLEHVLATNVSLWLIGREIETLLGTTSFLAVYFLGATGGAIRRHGGNFTEYLEQRDSKKKTLPIYISLLLKIIIALKVLRNGHLKFQ